MTEEFSKNLEREEKGSRGIGGSEFDARLDNLRLQRLWQLFVKKQITPENKEGVIYLDTTNNKLCFGIDGKWAHITFTTTSTSSTSTSTS